MFSEVLMIGTPVQLSLCLRSSEQILVFRASAIEVRTRRKCNIGANFSGSAFRNRAALF